MLDKRDREEIEKLVEIRIQHWQQYIESVDRQRVFYAGPEDDYLLEELERKQQWGQGKVEYYQSLLERVRAENASSGRAKPPPGRAFGPRT